MQISDEQIRDWVVRVSQARLNFRLMDVTLVPEMRKPFDLLAEGHFSEASRGDWIRTSDLLNPILLATRRNLRQFKGMQQNARRFAPRFAPRGTNRTNPIH